MKTRLVTFMSVLFIISFTCSASGGEDASCGFDEKRQWLLENDPEYARAVEENEARINRLMRTKDVFPSDQILTIPVVVHVIHLGEDIGTGTNISDAQIQSAIDAMNVHYQNTESTHGYEDTNIRFCLAVRDPADQPHTGINRVDGTSVTNYATQGIIGVEYVDSNEIEVKALSRWPNTDYYNIWVVSEINNNNAGVGTQGYAYRPGAGPEIDGAVILYNAFGTEGNVKPYTSMSITATHEVGHGLNLLHPFEGASCTETDCNTEGDQVCDTPPHTNDDMTCDFRECGVEHYENYMDYAEELCQNEFSDGQTLRMRAALQASRPTLVESDACVPVVEPVSNFSAPSPTCTGDVTFTDLSTNGPTSWAWSFPGGNPSSSTLRNPVISYSSPGVYDVSLTASNSIGNGNTETKTGYLTVYAPPPAACTVDSTEPISMGIFNLTFNTINNTSFGADDDGGYQDFTCTHVTQLVPGGSYPISVTTGQVDDEDVRVYIDYNNDGVFDAEKELAFSSDDTMTNHAGDVDTPLIVVTDTILRMRVVSDFSDLASPPSACTDQKYGQAEDYGVVFVPDSAPVTDFTARPRYACANNTVQFSDLSRNGAYSWNWSFEGGSPDSSTTNSPAVIYDTPGRYDASLTVSNSQGPGQQETKRNFIEIFDQAVTPACTVTTIDLSNGYHTGIHNVFLGSINNSTGNAYEDDQSSGTSGHMDFTCSETTKLKLGWMYSISVSAGDTAFGFNNEYVSAYIDFNGDGTLDVEERILQSESSIGERSGDFTVPLTAATGKMLLLRVMSDISMPADACDQPTIGQVEDYAVIIGPPGDINSDGDTDISDALIVLMHIAGYNPEEINDIEADINGDGKLDMAEALFIIQWVGGLR